MAGSVQSNIFQNNPGPVNLPANSYYSEIEKRIPVTPEWKETPVKMFADDVVKDVLRGAEGRVWHGESASVIRWVVPFMPQWVFVS